MYRMSTPFILGLFFAPIVLPPLHAQTTASIPADTNATAAKPTPTGQAPDDVMKKLSDLVHAGKYAEAQQLTAGLLLAYPEDQRLIKAKVLLDKSFASSKTADPAASASATQLAGMEKVDYNALIELARQAQQTTDLEQQTTLLKQFMKDSDLFLQKHPTEMLLWQLRAASAISLNDLVAGYGAGQKIIASGAADSNDPNLQQLLAQLKNKGWLDEKEATKQAKYNRILGIWSWHSSRIDKRGHVYEDHSRVEFSMYDSGVGGYFIQPNGDKPEKPFFRVTILDSGEMGCKYPTPVLSCEIDDQNGTMKIDFTDPEDPKLRGTWLFHKQ